MSTSVAASPVDIWAGYVKQELAPFNDPQTLLHDELRSTNDNICVIRVTGATRVPFSALEAVIARGDVRELDIVGTDQAPVALVVGIRRSKAGDRGLSGRARGGGIGAAGWLTRTWIVSACVLLLALALAAVHFLSGELSVVRKLSLLS